MRTQERVCTTYLVNYCQFIVSLTDCGVPERWLNDGEVFCWDVLSLKNVSSFSFILEPYVGSSLKFFVEGSILAQAVSYTHLTLPTTF